MSSSTEVAPGKETALREAGSCAARVSALRSAAEPEDHDPPADQPSSRLPVASDETTAKPAPADGVSTTQDEVESTARKGRSALRDI